MRLVLRRARGAKGLLLAAAGATLVATVALTGLAGYNRGVVDSGTRRVLTSAAPEEKSILVRGSAGGSPATLIERDRALRARFETGLAGLETTIFGAGYAAGRQLSGDTGGAVPDSRGAVYASVVFLDRLAEHAALVSGVWPRPNGTPVQTALAEPVAATLRVGVGDRIPITDGFTGRVTEVTVVGIWRPKDAADTYWRLVPEVMDGVLPQSATYGPLTVHRDDFIAHFLTNASAGWLIEPDMSGVTRMPALDRLATSAREVTGTVRKAVGIGESGLASTRIDQLVERLQRANLVGRSALVTPMLLVVVLGGYALLLVAVLLIEHRRGESALLRARGAANVQLAGLAAREAALVVLPAAALAPLLAVETLRYAERVPALAAVSLRLDPRLDALIWTVAAIAAVGCAVAMLGPSLRRRGSYVAELASRSRPSRRSLVQRAGVDVVLVGVALLSWQQLRQYSSPLAGARTGDLGIDPLLAAAPTLGVLAGAVVALRVLPPLTRLAERYVDRKPWTATMLGMWQAGRRPHAGPVLLLALAVAVSTLAWCLAGTSERSLVDQADHRVGADLRLTEVAGFAPDDRPNQLAGLPGATTVLPAWRDSLRLGPTSESASLVAIDARAGGELVRLRPDLAGGSTIELFGRVTEDRIEAPFTALPPEAQRLTGEVRTSVANTDVEVAVNTYAMFAEPAGGHRRVLLGTSRDSEPARFSVELPAGAGPLRLAGFLVETVAQPGLTINWRLTDLRASADQSRGSPVDLRVGGEWRSVDRTGVNEPAWAGDNWLSARYLGDLPDRQFARGGSTVQMAIVPPAETGPVPLVATPQALAALRLHVGDETRLFLGAAEVDVRIVGVAAAFPGATRPATLFTDLPSLSNRLFHDYGIVRTAQEWWVAVQPEQRAEAAAAAGRTGGLGVLDRRAVARELARDPYGVGARVALFAAALGAVLLAAGGIAVDVSATARRRATELAVLHTLGAGHRLIARSLVAEQAFLAGMGVLVGLLVGVAVAATMAPLVILTPSADRPTPTPSLRIEWLPVAATAVGLLLLALGFGALVAATLRRRLAASQLRIGEEG
jgi:hypothetical protein